MSPKIRKFNPPITQNDHVLILGWANGSPAIVRELVLSEGRVKRFLRRIGASRLAIQYGQWIVEEKGNLHYYAHILSEGA